MDDPTTIPRLLRTLEHGAPEAKIVVRIQLAETFYGRGELDYVVECVEQNIRNGAAFAEMTELLAWLRRGHGRPEEASILFSRARHVAEQAEADTFRSKSGGVECPQCGYSSAPTRRTCKECRGRFDTLSLLRCGIVLCMRTAANWIGRGTARGGTTPGASTA